MITENGPPSLDQPLDPEQELQQPAKRAKTEPSSEQGPGVAPAGLDSAPHDALQAQGNPAALQPAASEAKPEDEPGLAAQPAAVAADALVTKPIVAVGAYSQRERHSQTLEESGAITFEYLMNDGSMNSNLRLIGLKNVFMKQLPNMPREYVARLVLDRRHRSVVISQGICTVLGGVTYRPFPERRFGEIAFCAVSANEQVKGFGTRLMNHTKELARRRDGLEYFLTYADNAAVGYFEKQGFSTKLSLPRDQWHGWIKDYDSVTLMECRIDLVLPHTRLPDMFATQRAALEAAMQRHSACHLVRPSMPSAARPCEPAAIPGVVEAGWTPEQDEAPPFRLLGENGVQNVDPATLSVFMHVGCMQMALGRLMGHEEAWPFVEPVSATDVPDYYTIIKDPINFSTIRQRLEAGNFYRSLALFTADVRHLCQNARVYNSADTFYYKSADKLESLYDSLLNSHLVFDSSVA